MVRAKGAWLLFLPPYSPDLNPIEWLSQNSRRFCESAPREASMTLRMPSATSSPSFLSPNARTSSKPQDMRQNKRDKLLLRKNRDRPLVVRQAAPVPQSASAPAPVPRLTPTETCH
ncbi:hypothetical protein [Pseudorhizobium tarimense]|uniref:hypothetical protein n=1 Tax=Pseudorhizobium tarimense TaxID=1079109 RepID=UPI0035E3D4EE